MWMKVAFARRPTRARIFKLLRCLRINSKKSIPPAYVTWRVVRQPYTYSVPDPHRLFLYRTRGVIFFIDYCTAIRDT
jgi:hypothetical protein